MLDEIIPKLLREYMDTDDPARRAELVQVLQDYGAFPRIFEVCDKALSAQSDGKLPRPKAETQAAKESGAVKKSRSPMVSTSDHFVVNVE